METELCFLHFNDVYHIADVEHISRIAHFLRSRSTSSSSPEDGSFRPLTIFSGDAFSPSLEASILKGEHMTDLLNHLQVDVACYGNHDFDFGEARLIELSKITHFPWVLSNAIHGLDGYASLGRKFLACAEEYVIKSMGGYRIGFFGLAGTDWPSNCQHLPPLSQILPPHAVARNLARRLRLDEKCDFVIAVTHMRLAEDLEVAKATADGETKVDLILGGHDHHVVRRLAGETDERPDIIQQGFENDAIVQSGQVADIEGNVRIIKSGTDWKGLSIVRLIAKRNQDGMAYVSNVKLKQYTDLKRNPDFTLLPSCPAAPRLLASVQECVTSLVRQPLLYTNTPLDGRSWAIRSQETSLGNMLADAFRAFYNTDIALVNSGSIRCDRVLYPTLAEHPPLCVKDIIDICPFDNAFVVKQVRGSVLFDALENSVSDMHTDGRFLQCSGLHLVASWQRQQGRRILNAFSVTPSGPPQRIERTRKYTVAMVSFIASGFDGYSCFQDEETLISEEGAMTDTSLLLQIFGYKTRDPSGCEGPIEDSTASAIDRARRAIVVGQNERDHLPIVGPTLDGRIKFLDGPAL